MAELFTSRDLLPIEFPLDPLGDEGFTRVVNANKSGEISPEEEGKEKQKTGWSPAIFGSIFANEVDAALNLSEEEQQQRWEGLRIKSPWEYMRWSLLAYDAVEPLRDVLSPEDDAYIFRSKSEIRMYLPKGAQWAARRVGALLQMEQHQPDEATRPVSDALRRGLLIGNPGELTGQPANYLEQLMKNARPETEVDDLVYTMRTHHRAGSLAMFQNIRADLVNVQYEKDDHESQQIGDLFLAVLGTGNACKPDDLNQIMMPYITADGEKQYLRGPEIVHRAAEYILNGKLKFQIGEIKTMTLIGDRYQDFDRIYTFNKLNLGFQATWTRCSSVPINCLSLVS